MYSLILATVLKWRVWSHILYLDILILEQLSPVFLFVNTHCHHDAFKKKSQKRFAFTLHSKSTWPPVVLKDKRQRLCFEYWNYCVDWSQFVTLTDFPSVRFIAISLPLIVFTTITASHSHTHTHLTTSKPYIALLTGSSSIRNQGFLSFTRIRSHLLLHLRKGCT